MKERITKMIRNFFNEYEQKNDISTKWGEPLVGFVDANHPYILNLKELIPPTHRLPIDVLSDASIVIAYFIPFTTELANTNRIPGDIASPEWALAYEFESSKSWQEFYYPLFYIVFLRFPYPYFILHYN